MDRRLILVQTLSTIMVSIEKFCKGLGVREEGRWAVKQVALSISEETVAIRKTRAPDSSSFRPHFKRTRHG
jgi:hypothetical protein